MLPFHAVLFACASWDGLLQNNADDACGSRRTVVDAKCFALILRGRITWIFELVW
jgi:hypothetical protein